MTQYRQGQIVRFRPVAARTPQGHGEEDIGTITQVLVQTGNAQNRNTDVTEDDPRYEIQNRRGKKSVIMEMDIVGEEK
ncbi:hypothetical protein MPDQ_007772 [Monascus purpureus]|uniref:Hypervirulence associated protein TUDOR domain-containing protein n=1 Tax=Monascus purpureus TaxID=5098 RepID=A0A507QRA3_MONPU|nr:hypothetical protein MPDQ_007772 [Monascus purpureus]BDD57566.1 hypothetical protein MAP00_002919 [Monascus purpureus]